MQIHIISKVFNQILWFFRPRTWKLFYFEIYLVLWCFYKTIMANFSDNKHQVQIRLCIHIKFDLNFSKVASNWIQWLKWLKEGKFEVPISTIKLVTYQPRLKTPEPLKFVTFKYRGVEMSELPVICKMRCRSAFFSTKAVKRFFRVYEHHKSF
jgi:hypothetical protein